MNPETTEKKQGFFKKQLSDFKEFALKGSVMDMAVGVVIGGAFSKIVTSLVDYIIMPLVGLIVGGVDFSMLSITVNDATIKYGAFIQSIVDFLLIALCIFIFIKLVSAMKRKLLPAEQDEAPALTKSENYLKQIRDLLKEQQTK